MSPLIKSLRAALRQSSKLLLRDFFELEELQASKNSNNMIFASRGIDRCKQILCEDLAKHTGHSIILDGKIVHKVNGKYHCIIEFIDGINNFHRGMPFFAINLMLKDLASDEITAAVFELPALGQVLYAEKGCGAWVEKLSGYDAKSGRARVSGISQISKSVLSLGAGNLKLDAETLKVTALASEHRLFGSNVTAIANLVTGRSDIAAISNIKKSARGAYKLLISESGGIIINNSEEFFLASNHNLAEHLRKSL